MTSDRPIAITGDEPTVHAGHSSFLTGLALALVCLVPPVLAIMLRPPAPLDELRYLGVAWEMWLRGDFLVPHLNGATYSHKPPLLFWLMHAGWAVFGVNDWSPRLVSALSGLLAVGLVQRLARDLWPQDPAPARIAPWLLAGASAWLFCIQMVLFDVLLTVWVLVGMRAIWRAAHGDQRRGWILLGLAIGGGVLTKGPVVLLHLALPAALAPLWQSQLRDRLWRWYGMLLGAIVLGATVALAWAVPAAIHGGPEYADAIFWHQTAGRMKDSFAHARSWWYYLPILPILFMPWVILPSAWRRLPAVPRDGGMAFLLTWLAPVVLVMSVVSAKQPHYLLPLLPALALIVARSISHGPQRARVSDRVVLTAAMTVLALAGSAYLVWLAHKQGAPWTDSGAGWPLITLPVSAWIAFSRSARSAIQRTTVAMALLMVTLLAGVFHNPAGSGEDLRIPARRVHELQNSGALIAFMNHYQEQLTYLGRLEQPVTVVPANVLPEWAKQHPGAYLLIFKDPLPPGITAVHVAEYSYRAGRLRLWRIGTAASQ